MARGEGMELSTHGPLQGSIAQPAAPYTIRMSFSQRAFAILYRIDKEKCVNMIKELESVKFSNDYIKCRESLVEEYRNIIEGDIEFHIVFRNRVREVHKGLSPRGWSDSRIVLTVDFLVLNKLPITVEQCYRVQCLEPSKFLD